MHPDVVHGGDATAHQDAADDSRRQGETGLGNHEQGYRGGQDGRCHRQQNRRPVIAHRNGQSKGFHPHVVHRPDAGAHGERATAQPGTRGLFRGRRSSVPRGRVPHTQPGSQSRPTTRPVDSRNNQRAQGRRFPSSHLQPGSNLSTMLRLTSAVSVRRDSTCEPYRIKRRTRGKLPDSGRLARAVCDYRGLIKTGLSTRKVAGVPGPPTLQEIRVRSTHCKLL